MFKHLYLILISVIVILLTAILFLFAYFNSEDFYTWLQNNIVQIFGYLLSSITIIFTVIQLSDQKEKFLESKMPKIALKNVNYGLPNQLTIVNLANNPGYKLNVSFSKKTFKKIDLFKKKLINQLKDYYLSKEKIFLLENSEIFDFYSATNLYELIVNANYISMNINFTSDIITQKKLYEYHAINSSLGDIKLNFEEVLESLHLCKDFIKDAYIEPKESFLLKNRSKLIINFNDYFNNYFNHNDYNLDLDKEKLIKNKFLNYKINNGNFFEKIKEFNSKFCNYELKNNLKIFEFDLVYRYKYYSLKKIKDRIVINLR